MKSEIIKGKDTRGRITSYTAKIGPFEGVGKSVESAEMELAATVAWFMVNSYRRSYLHCPDGTMFCLYALPSGSWNYDMSGAGRKWPSTHMFGEKRGNFSDAYASMLAHAVDSFGYVDVK